MASSNGSARRTNRGGRGVSIAIYPMSLGGSNGERLEIEAMFVPPYNAASYGLSLTTSPDQADVILLYGSLTEKFAPVVYRLLASLPPDVKLIAVGSETLSTSPFRLAYGVAGPLLEAAERPLPDEEIKAAEAEAVATLEEGGPPPVRLKGIPLPPHLRLVGFIAGAPPDPQAILNGILQLAN